MSASKFTEKFANSTQPFMLYKDQEYSYEWLSNRIDYVSKQLRSHGVTAGSVVEIASDFSPTAVSMLFALARLNAIIVPLTNIGANKTQEYRAIVQAQFAVHFSQDDDAKIEPLSHHPNQTLLLALKTANTPGLIIMSSGSTGRSKAIVHDFSKLLNKFCHPGKKLRVIAFLLFDHIGGINTLLYTLNNLGTVVVPADRSPEKVCQAMSKHNVQALTTSPTFLNLLVLSDLIKQFDLSWLKYINYGSEPMPAFLLKRLLSIFPEVRFSQAYGLSEVGVLDVRSKSSNSLFIKINTTNNSVRVRDNMLEIKSNTSMLGYLNAEAPFTEDGWFKTGDLVEQDGEYFKILGRQSELINVGGNKVYPAEVENVLLEVDGVLDAAVAGESNAILGNLIAAKIQIAASTDKTALRKQIRQHCQAKLPQYMVPHKISFTDTAFHGTRHKKMRKPITATLN